VIDYKIARQRVQKKTVASQNPFSPIDFLVIGAGCACIGRDCFEERQRYAREKNRPRRLLLFASCDRGCPAPPCRIGRFFAAGLMRKRDAVAVFSKTDDDDETHTHQHSAGPLVAAV
jgi:hypothetical protein